MNTPGVLARVVMAVLLAAPLPAASFDLGFLRNASASSFTERDRGLVTNAVDQVLAATQDGQPVSWGNPDSGRQGTVTAVKNMQQQGSTCRELKIYNQVAKASAESHYRFRKQPDGSWKTVAP